MEVYMKKLVFIALGLAIIASSTIQADSLALAGGAVVFGGTAALIAGSYNVIANRLAIHKIKKELKQANSMKSHTGAIIELYNWNTAGYPTARAIKGAEQHCVNALVADAMSGKLVGIIPGNYAGYNGQLHWSVANGISDRLDSEITTLNDKLNELLPYVSGGYLFSLDYCAKLERACHFAGANVNDPSTWSTQQEAQIDQFMQARAVNTYTKYLKGYINYGKAARLYWDIFKKRCRLEAIKQALVKDIRFLNARQQQQPAVQVNVR
jgi:hypothetical protein